MTVNDTLTLAGRQQKVDESLLLGPKSERQQAFPQVSAVRFCFRPPPLCRQGALRTHECRRVRLIRSMLVDPAPQRGKALMPTRRRDAI